MPRRARAWLALSVAVAITASVMIGGAAHAANDAPAGKVAFDKNADLTFAYAAGPNGLDPVRPGYLFPFMALIYDRLTQINDNLEVEPMLAESWEFAKDGSTLEFKLRNDAMFTDGTKIDAGRGEGEPRPSALHAPYSTHLNALKSVTNVTAVNPTTVRLTLVPGQGVQLPSGSRVEPRDDRQPEGHRRPQRRPHARDRAPATSRAPTSSSRSRCRSRPARRSTRSATTGPSTGTRPRAVSSASR